MEFVVDFQGFKRPINEFVFKEVAVTPLEDDSPPSVYLFEPPHEWNFLPAKYKSENTWLEHNYHGISWDRGDVPYEEVIEILQNHLRDASKVHVKGLEKKRLLEKIVPHVYNLEEGAVNQSRGHLASTVCSAQREHVESMSSRIKSERRLPKYRVYSFHNTPRLLVSV